MRHSNFYIFAAIALGAGLALSAAPASAKTVKECNAEYSAQKDALKAAGTKKADFVASCRAEADAGAPAAAAPAPAPAAAEAPASGKTAKECNAEYSANKDAIKSSGKTKKAFVADCRAGSETVPTAAAPAAPMAAPAAAAPPPAAPAATAPMAPAPMAAKPGAAVAGGFTSDAQAKAKCPADTVVWVNTKSHIYHFAGTHDYGDTKTGAYMCEADAKGAGSRAAKNETHP
jgi:hypothetical protein